MLDYTTFFYRIIHYPSLVSHFYHIIFKKRIFHALKSIKISINGEDISRESIIYLQCKTKSISLSSRVRVMQLKSLLSWQFHAH